MFIHLYTVAKSVTTRNASWFGFNLCTSQVWERYYINDIRVAWKSCACQLCRVQRGLYRIPRREQQDFIGDVVPR